VSRYGTLLLAVLASASLAACGDEAKLDVAAGTGPTPQLPPPNKTMIPTVNIAPAQGWPEGAKPTVASGMQVNALASGLDHPRWLYVLPNGDVLVAESNAPADRKSSSGVAGIRGWVMGMVMKRAGAATPSANRITLLRDADGDGTAEQRRRS
jgi:glucose/arabinose dehydrogenase